MAITRTPFIDDDGSGTTGTVWNNAEKQILYNQIDAALSSGTAPLKLASAVAQNVSGPINNFQPTGGATAVLWWLGATAITDITGILAEADLTQHLIVNTAGNAINFYNQHANSAAANRIIGPGFGTYTLNAWGAVWIIYSSFYTSWLIQKA